MNPVGDGWRETVHANKNSQADVFAKSKEMQTKDVDGVLSHPS